VALARRALKVSKAISPPRGDDDDPRVLLKWSSKGEGAGGQQPGLAACWASMCSWTMCRAAWLESVGSSSCRSRVSDGVA